MRTWCVGDGPRGRVVDVFGTCRAFTGVVLEVIWIEERVTVLL